MKIQKNIKIAKFSSFRIGGTADFFCSVKTPEEAIEAFEWARANKKLFRVFSGGTKILFPDKNFKGLLIKFDGGKINILKNNKIEADAGVDLLDLVEKSADAGLAGLELLAGIPGAIGGAIAGNAGAYGRSTSDSVEKVEIWDGTKRRWLTNKECQFAYRESIFKHNDWMVLRAIFKLQKGNRISLKKSFKEKTETRWAKFGQDPWCVGSFFKNVPVKNLSTEILAKIDKTKIVGADASVGTSGQIPSGYLLDEAGARKMKCGGAAVAGFHGNFIINTGNATAKDVKTLAVRMQKAVLKKFDIALEKEARYF